MRKLNVLFIVQGDGRGHMTQALAIQRILVEGGHRICGILLGRDPDQPIPDFFAAKVTAPIVRYQSFAFFNNKANTAIDSLASVIGNLRRLPKVVKSLFSIRREIRARKPDVVVNFLEPLAGICYMLFRPGVPLACVANQYLFLHPDYQFPPGRRLDRFFIKVYAHLTSAGASRRMALSLRPRPDWPSGCAVIPPLLRPEVLDFLHPSPPATHPLTPIPCPPPSSPTDQGEHLKAGERGDGIRQAKELNGDVNLTTAADCNTIRPSSPPSTTRLSSTTPRRGRGDGGEGEIRALDQPFFLIYLLKSGLREQIVDWHKRHPEVELHCFTDQPQDADEFRFDETLTFHPISEQRFLDLMVRCRGMIATAGYQTLCEAMYYGKPILIVPVGNHFEQACNAHEAELLGAGLGATHFDLDRFLEYVPKHKADVERFRAWVAEAPRRVLRVIETIAKPSE